MKLPSILTKFLRTGKHPATDREKSAVLDAARSALLTTNPMQTNKNSAMADFLPQNMALERVEEIIKETRGKRRVPGQAPPLVNALCAEIKRNEAAPPARPAAASPRPPARPTPTGPLPLHGGKPDPQKTPAGVMPSASNLAKAILDEQDKRAAAALIRTRAQLEGMKPAAITAFFKAGGKLTD